MFAKDVELLNQLYNNKIITEMNLGPLGDQDPGAGYSPSQIQKVELPQKDLKNSEEDCEHASCNHVTNHEDTNAGMAKQSLYRLVKLTAMLHDLVCKEDNVEPWVLTKVTEALNHIESVYGYMDYENFKQKVEQDMLAIREEAEGDLYNAISSGGSEILSKINDILASESREVLENLLYETITSLEAKTN